MPQAVDSAKVDDDDETPEAYRSRLAGLIRQQGKNPSVVAELVRESGAETEVEWISWANEQGVPWIGDRLRMRYARELVQEQRHGEPLPDGRPNFLGPAPLPSPTTAIPGTAAKIEVLRLRVLAGQDLTHPDDAVLGESCPMPRFLAEQLLARDAAQRVSRGEVPKKKQRIRKRKKKSIPWRLYPCCLFGAVMRGRCDCGLEKGAMPNHVAPFWAGIALPRIACRRLRRRRRPKFLSLFDAEQPHHLAG